MNTLKDDKAIKDLHRDLIYNQHQFKKAKLKLRSLIKEQRACSNSGYIQHYPEYNSMINSQMLLVSSLRKQLRITADTLKYKLSNNLS